ncbi:F-box protein SKIP19-like [Coffea arabica]|uniref:F-box protein SKIP19-like n=1 Tax=Coffea arabica TaxID=13443 RepID=A0A6P6UCY6_COFAR
MIGRKKNLKIKQVWRRKGSSASTSVSPPPPPPPWTELPRDITANILQRLSVVDILESAQKVCTTWRSVCLDPAMWRVIDMYDCADYEDEPYDMEIMVQHAVDRSQGQLVDISIGSIGTDELLEYIAERSGKLKRLRLAFCDSISGEGLTEAVKRLPLLEELHLFFISMPSEALEIVGCSCPLLKSFTINRRSNELPHQECDKEAAAIAKTMPGLHHLHLLGNKMTNEGLKAILDNCAKLESLDLRKCYYVNLDGDLGKRCSQEITHLRLPNDSTADYEFDEELDDCEGLHYSDSFDVYSSGISDFDVSDYDYYFDDFEDFNLWDMDSDYAAFLGLC